MTTQENVLQFTRGVDDWESMTRETFTFRLSEKDFEAFSAAAAKAGVPLGEWVRRRCVEGLPKSVQRGLTPVRKRGRPKKPKGEQ